MTDATERADGARSAETADEQTRLLNLVGELVAANQELRFKVTQLEQRATREAREYAEAAAVYRLLLP